MFDRFARAVSKAAGSRYAFGLAVLSVLVWAVLGPRYAYSETWQLVINTGTTIVTFLMVFAIQATQNRDSAALHAKLDALVIAVPDAPDEVAGCEEVP